MHINTRWFQNDLISFSHADDVLTLLVHLGYLAFEDETQEVFLPNREAGEELHRARRAVRDCRNDS